MYQEIWSEAVKAGNKALLECKPTPVGFYSADLDDKPLGPVEVEAEGLCGGAYIVLHDSRSEFVKWVKANHPDSISKNYPKGYSLSLREAHGDYNGQSAERYDKCGEAFANVLRAAGINCHVHNYLT